MRTIIMQEGRGERRSPLPHKFDYHSYSPPTAFDRTLAQPHRRVIVIDGDGAALMRLGAMTTIGYERPANLCHILLDNQRHESTGGQSTVSHSVDFSAIAGACGYEKVGIATTPQQVKQWITTAPNSLSFLHVSIKPGTTDKLPRTKVTPIQVAQRLRQFMQLGANSLLASSASNSF